MRNVDLWIFGDHKARDDRPAVGVVRDMPRLEKIVADIGTGDVNAFYLHLCEGVRGDERSAKEFQAFLDSGAATPATVIHGSALEGDLHTLADAGCRLVWSPQSNLRLYGSTTLAGAAMAAGMPVALGADWLPSGSTSLLAEMKVARRQLALEGTIAAADLVAMVTSVAAGWPGCPTTWGRPAEDGRPTSWCWSGTIGPVRERLPADPSWVELVSIGGDITYAREDWFGRLSGNAASPTIESLLAWGKPCGQRSVVGVDADVVPRRRVAVHPTRAACDRRSGLDGATSCAGRVRGTGVPVAVSEARLGARPALVRGVRSQFGARARLARCQSARIYLQRGGHERRASRLGAARGRPRAYSRVMARLQQTEGLTDEQDELLGLVREFVDEQILPVATALEHADEYPTKIVEQMQEMGIFGLMIPEEYGGLGESLLTR